LLKIFRGLGHPWTPADIFLYFATFYILQPFLANVSYSNRPIWRQIWRHLEESGDTDRHLAPDGANHRQKMAPAGAIWRHLAPSSGAAGARRFFIFGTDRHLAPSKKPFRSGARKKWRHLAPDGAIWFYRHLAPSGDNAICRWRHLAIAPSGDSAIWRQMVIAPDGDRSY
jgi:hypothetical protein